MPPRDPGPSNVDQQSAFLRDFALSFAIGGAVGLMIWFAVPHGTGNLNVGCPTVSENRHVVFSPEARP